MYIYREGTETRNNRNIIQATLWSAGERINESIKEPQVVEKNRTVSPLFCL